MTITINLLLYMHFYSLSTYIEKVEFFSLCQGWDIAIKIPLHRLNWLVRIQSGFEFFFGIILLIYLLCERIFISIESLCVILGRYKFRVVITGGFLFNHFR